MSNTLSFAQTIIDKAKSTGADAADAIVVDSSDINVRYRMGNTETIERSESKDLGLRVLIKGKDGLQQAIVSSNDVTEDIIPDLVERAVDMANASPVDPYISFAPETLWVKDLPALDISDSTEPAETELIKVAQLAEEAALAIDQVNNSEGSEADFGTVEVALVTSDGFAQSYHSTSCSVSASVIAGEGLNMETDYDYAVARYLDDLADPEQIGASAGSRAVAKLNPRKIDTCEVPVIFDARVARSILSELAAAINGAAVARGTTFLKDKMGEQLFADGVTVVDDPHRKRGIASKPFDGEGVAGRKRNIIENGTLTSWLLDMRSAKQLGLETTGHAARGTSSPPSPSSTNFYLQAGQASVEELMADIKQGLFVTDAFGMGCNTVTGDYSNGAYGFWIENGQKAYPVSEITIAGHMLEMFKQLTPANDLTFAFGTNAPSVRIDNMTIAGV